MNCHEVLEDEGDLRGKGVRKKQQIVDNLLEIISRSRESHGRKTS